MNLVIDDAVEVKMKTKNQEESRRPLGMQVSMMSMILTLYRPHPFERRQCIVDPNASNIMANEVEGFMLGVGQGFGFQESESAVASSVCLKTLPEPNINASSR
jgi:hypothetical protein